MKHKKSKSNLTVLIGMLLLAFAPLNFLLVSWQPAEEDFYVPIEYKGRSNMTLVRGDQYQVVFPNASALPYTNFTPHLNVIWSRGWYNAPIRLPKGVPMNYYNERGRSDRPTPLKVLEAAFDADDVCLAEYVWVRGRDLSWFASKFLPTMNCTIHLITSDSPTDVPKGTPGGSIILKSDKIISWYAQDKAADLDKIKPIPLGLPIHYGFSGSPHSLDTVEQMTEIRTNAPAFEDRSRAIFYDKGTMGGSARRTFARKEAYSKLGQCNNIVMNEKMGHQLGFWERLSSHQFGVCVTGVGWDTFRIWEMLFFGVIPIVKASPLDLLLIPAHVPVLIVKDWSEICNLSDRKYNQIVAKYKGWIKNSHYWLQPSLWIPRNQDLMDQLCDASPGCERSIR